MKTTVLLKLPMCAGLTLSTLCLALVNPGSAAVVDDFDNNQFVGWYSGGDSAGVSQLSFTETNQQLTIAANFAATDVDDFLNTFTAVWPSGSSAFFNAPIGPSVPAELRLDVAQTSQDDAFVTLLRGGGGHGYSLGMDQNEIFLLKYRTESPHFFAFFFWETLETKTTNVTLVLKLTQDGSDVIIETKVLDREAGNQVLFERTTVDTPASDPVLPNRARKNLAMDPDGGVPWVGTGGGLIGCWPITDGTNPHSEITVDNFEVNGKVIDSFDDNRIWMSVGENYTETTYTETNQQLNISSYYSGISTTGAGRNTLVAVFTQDNLSPPGTNRVELRVDLVGATQHEAFAGLGWGTMNVGGYLFAKDEDELFLKKYGPSLDAYFFWETEVVKNENVILALDFQKNGADLVILTRVLDKDNGNAVLFERAVTDTAEADPVLSSRSRKGLLMYPDSGAPWRDGGLVHLNLWQITDGSQPAAAATFDNLQLGPMQPALAILQTEAGLLVSWPWAPGHSFGLEQTPSLSPPAWTGSATYTNNPALIPTPQSPTYFRLIEVQP